MWNYEFTNFLVSFTVLNCTFYGFKTLILPVTKDDIKVSYNLHN